MSKKPEISVGSRVRHIHSSGQTCDDYGDVVEKRVITVRSDNGPEPELQVETYTVGDLKKLLDKMDDSIKFTFSDLKIHFG